MAAGRTILLHFPLTYFERGGPMTFMGRMSGVIPMLACAAVFTQGAVPAGVVPPGDCFEVPAVTPSDGAPKIFEHSQEAGPDETLFMVGSGLTGDVLVWGSQPGQLKGGRVQGKAQLVSDTYLAFTIPQGAYDGPMVVSVKNAAGCSAPVVINAPRPWWCSPASAVAGEAVRVFGRNLACRPDGERAFVWVRAEGKPGRWLKATSAEKYAVAFTLPSDLEPGAYEVWLHAGRGGEWGWGGPVPLAVRKEKRSARVTSLRPANDGTLAIQEAVDVMAERGGGIVRLPEGRFAFSGTLRIPARVTLSGAGRDKTVLDLKTSPNEAFACFKAVGWGVAPGAIHSPGDTMTYAFSVPQTGRWTVWLRYGTDMSPWRMTGVSSNTTVQVDGEPPVVLANLPNTGGFGTYRWSRNAEVEIKKGKHTLTWRNVKGGGLSLDAFVLTRRPGDVPSDKPWPATTLERVVIHGEECVTFKSKEGVLAGSTRAAVWLSGCGASLADLSVYGNEQVNIGIAIRGAATTEWIDGCTVRRVRVIGCEGKQAENSAVHVRNLRGGSVRDSELWGRTPLFLSGARQSVFANNRLVSVTRFGGNSEAAILGRTEPLEECVIENNTVASPPGAESGGPTARRLIWLSTGHGSVAHNWLANNGVERAGAAGQARFGGVAGTDQNVGEMILFEGNHRTLYFGPLVEGDPQSVTLPATVPPTPDERLGSVKREQLAYDDGGRETPFWPPDADDGTEEPPVGEYYVTVFAGTGQGQTRRVVGRSGGRLAVDRPWRVAPGAGSVVAVGTMFHQNLIVGNHVPDGMTGVQLWISCVENVVSGNTVERQRKPGLFLYANGSTLASSMPRTWNRGISPLFWNLAEGNRVEECSDGALITSGDAAGLPIEFPRALGNVLRHNTFTRSRGNGVVITSRKAHLGGTDRSASVVGTIVEFNAVRDAPVAYHAAEGSDAVVLRRNHAYFWYPVNLASERPVAFQIDNPATRVMLELNSAEGKAGTGDSSFLEVLQSWKK